MPQIQQLPPNVVNKIAAGEVVERPASVTKELMENAVDAGATRVDVQLEKGGTRRIRVVDNGCGIAADELLLAVTSHATSKIRSDEDLFRVATLGFRGEALASIAAVSRMTLRSRAAEADSGTQIEVTGGRIEGPTPCGCPIGTSVEVEDLFFNTPVRRKFLRTTQTEVGHCTEAFTRLALACPQVHFTLTSNERLVYDLPAVGSWRERIATFFGAELSDDLIAVESVDEATTLSGYVANPSHSRGNNRLQYLFLNGRFIRDRSLQHALSESYRGLLLTGRYPIAFLRLDLPAELVDVNVHPRKLEVKFQDGGRLYSQLLGTLRTRFLSTDLTARLQPTAATQTTGVPRSAVDEASGVATGQPATGAAMPSPAPLPLPNSPQQGALHADATAAHARQQLAADFLARRSGGLADPHPSQVPPAAGSDLTTHLAPPSLPEAAGGAPEPLPSVAGPEGPPAMQVMNRYLIAETDDGVIVIDQHALHERILYEQIREKVLAGAMETQTLLVPEPVDLAPEEAACVLDCRELLEQLGVKVEPFGGGTVLVSSYPAMLANWNPTNLVRSLAEQLTSGSKAPDRRDMLDGLLHMISCKAAIKAGDKLTGDEIAALLQQRDLAQDAHHCPHGRPTALVFTRDELDRQFKRT